MSAWLPSWPALVELAGVALVMFAYGSRVSGRLLDKTRGEAWDEAIAWAVARVELRRMVLIPGPDGRARWADSGSEWHYRAWERDRPPPPTAWWLDSLEANAAEWEAFEQWLAGWAARVEEVIEA